MATLTAAGIGASIGLGIALVVAGMQRREQSTGLSPTLWRRTAGLWGSQSRRARIWAISTLVAGAVIAILSGWLIAILLVPAAAIGIPLLLTEPPQREVAVLAALDRWIRLLGPSIATGKSIRDAMVTTRHQAPGLLSESVTRLVARLDQGWSTHDALLSMADDVSSADADAVLAALAIAAKRGGVGTRTTLAALSDNTADRLKVLREISAERAKPRAVVRQVTLITVGILGGSLLLGGSFFEPYQSSVGQLLALGLAAAYIGSLAMLRRRTIPAPTPRFLRADS